MSHGEGAIAAQRHARLLQSLASKLRHRNAEISAFKDVFTAHQGLLHINEKLRQQTLQQDKVPTYLQLGRNLHSRQRCAVGPNRRILLGRFAQ